MVIPKCLRFRSFTLDLARLSLQGPTGQIDLRPKSFEVLRYLVEHAGRVVTKDEGSVGGRYGQRRVAHTLHQRGASRHWR